MLFIKELKKICFSFIYVLFIGLLLFSWHENFYGVTTKEITGSQGNEVSISSGLTGGSILEKPEKNKESYGMKNKEVPDKIMCGGTDKLIMEYLANSYATYPFSYYKEVVLNENEQKEILNIIKEITGLNEQQINHLPDDYFPAVNGNVIHFGSNGTQSENGAFIRGISNLDNIHSADVFGQSLALIGVFLFIPIIRQELEVSVKEIVYTKVWSYRKSVSIRLICSFWMITVMITIFASIMRLQNCSFPFLKYVTVTILYAVFLGILGLLFSQLGNNVIIGYLASLGYWSFCQFDILTEENVLYIFPIISGEIEMGKLMILMSINSFLLVVFFLSVKETRGMYK